MRRIARAAWVAPRPTKIIGRRAETIHSAARAISPGSGEIGRISCGDVAEVGLGGHVLGAEALHQKAIAIILEALAARDVLLVADAVAFAQIDDPPCLIGRQRQAPVQCGRLGPGRKGQHQAGREECKAGRQSDERVEGKVSHAEILPRSPHFVVSRNGPDAGMRHAWI